jgi:hypothetical protein
VFEVPDVKNRASANAFTICTPPFIAHRGRLHRKDVAKIRFIGLTSKFWGDFFGKKLKKEGGEDKKHKVSTLNA